MKFGESWVRLPDRAFYLSWQLKRSTVLKKIKKQQAVWEKTQRGMLSNKLGLRIKRIIRLIMLIWPFPLLHPLEAKPRPDHWKSITWTCPVTIFKFRAMFWLFFSSGSYNVRHLMLFKSLFSFEFTWKHTRHLIHCTSLTCSKYKSTNSTPRW